MFKKLPFASPQAQIHDLSQTEPRNYSCVPGLHSSSHTWASQTSDSQLSNRRCVAEQQTVWTTAQLTHRTNRLILPSWCWHFQKQWLIMKGSSRSSASVQRPGCCCLDSDMSPEAHYQPRGFSWHSIIHNLTTNILYCYHNDTGTSQVEFVSLQCRTKNTRLCHDAGSFLFTCCMCDPVLVSILGIYYA